MKRPGGVTAQIESILHSMKPFAQQRRKSF